MQARFPLALTVIGLALLVASASGVFWGTADLPVDERLRALFRLEGARRHLELIVWEWRLPRVLVCALVGAALALCGVLMQTVLRNPLADPYLLGLSSGASAVAVAALVWLPVGITETLGVPTLAFLGALSAFALTIGLSARVGEMPDRLVVILAGVAISLLFQSVTAFFLHIADPHETQAALGWLMGSAASTRWHELTPLTVAVPVIALAAWLSGPQLDALLLGDERALALGVPVGIARLTVFVATAVLAGLSVAVVGIVGFVGLIVPHMARLLVGAAHRRLVPAAMLLGALTLVVVDLLCRMVLAPEEVPLGVLLALFAAPPFIVILRQVRHAR